MQNKAARVGFDWPSLAPVLDKLKEELAELEAEIAAAGAADRTDAKIEEEFGDLLFVVANVARHLKVDPEARCAPPTASSPAASTPSSASSPPLAALRRNRRSPRWTASGTRPRLRRKGAELARLPDR